MYTKLVSTIAMTLAEWPQSIRLFLDTVTNGLDLPTPDLQSGAMFAGLTVNSAVSPAL